jgi:hypothetical protein
MARRGTNGAHAIGLLAFVVAVCTLLAVLGGCGSDSESSDSSDSDSTDTSASPGPTGPDAELLSQLAAEGDDATFEHRYGGEIASGPSDEPVMVYAGRAGNDVVVYACDGVEGAWFGGSVEEDGSGRLETEDGAASVTLTADGDGLRSELEGGVFDGLSAMLAPLEDGVGALLRIEVAVEGESGATGGIIIGPTGLRGLVNIPSGTTSSPPTTLRATTTTAAATGSTGLPSVITSRTRLGLLTFRLIAPVTTGSTTTTTVRPTTTTSVAPTTTTGAPNPPAGGSPGGVGSGDPTSPVSSQTGGTVLSQCATLAATIASLVQELEDQNATLQLLAEQRTTLQQQLAGASQQQRQSLEQQLANVIDSIEHVQAQIEAIQEQIDALSLQLDTSCTNNVDSKP